MSGDLRAELARWGVAFTPPRRVTLRSLGFTTEGELSAVSAARAIRQQGATPDALFQVELAGNGTHLWRVGLTSFVSTNRVLTERNGLLMSIGLSLALPWWGERTRWLVDGLRALKGDDYSPVAWPGDYAVRLHRTPDPVSAVHLTILYRGRNIARG